MPSNSPVASVLQDFDDDPSSRRNVNLPKPSASKQYSETPGGWIGVCLNGSLRQQPSMNDMSRVGAAPAATVGRRSRSSVILTVAWSWPATTFGSARGPAIVRATAPTSTAQAVEPATSQFRFPLVPGPDVPDVA